MTVLQKLTRWSALENARQAADDRAALECESQHLSMEQSTAAKRQLFSITEAFSMVKPRPNCWQYARLTTWLMLGALMSPRSLSPRAEAHTFRALPLHASCNSLHRYCHRVNFETIGSLTSLLYRSICHQHHSSNPLLCIRSPSPIIPLYPQ